MEFLGMRQKVNESAPIGINDGMGAWGILKGFNQSAQRCEARATLGNQAPTIHQPCKGCIDLAIFTFVRIALAVPWRRNDTRLLDKPSLPFQ